jgi:enamine deaminase RidA (YjgF/YER057c/UK114 family)
MTALGLMVLLALPQDPGQMDPLLRAVDLNVGESAEVTLSDGTKASVSVVRLDEVRDTVRGAVRRAEVEVEVNGVTTVLTSANYQLPTSSGGVQIDCPITKGYLKNTSRDVWGLEKDVRLRLWPAASPWIRPGTLMYPVKQRWFASHTWMANEPIDAGSDLLTRKIYYHWGLDIGGSEGLVEVVAATDGIVVSVGDSRLEGITDPLVGPRYDVVYIRDDRGWHYRYSHLKTIETAIRLGHRVRIGQKLGTIGKEGGSGGWTHLHFDVSAMQPSGQWGIHDGYAFIWSAYRRQFAPQIIANARPRGLTWTGQSIELDATRSWAAAGITRYDWTFSDGSTATGPRPLRVFNKAGSYSEVLKITDANGRSAYDFASVVVVDHDQPEPTPPRLHATHYPTFGIQAGDPVTFKVRCFESTDGHETWDFGDGTRPVTTRSDGNVDQHARDGYAVVVHRFGRAGHYLVRVQRSDRRGQTGTAHLQVRVGPRKRLKFINPDNSFSGAVAVGGHTLAHTTQIMALNPQGNLIAEPRQQVRKAFDNLNVALSTAGTDLRRAVKINAYVQTDEVANSVIQFLSRRFRGPRKPAFSVVVGKLPHRDALVALDAVAVTERDWTPGVVGVERLPARSLSGTEAHVSLLPPGEKVYISGQAGRGTLAEASRGTMESLGRTLDYLGLKPHHVIQLKAFLQPMKDADTVRQEVKRFFESETLPPMVFVEWQSSEEVPVEIELIAWAGPGGETPGGRLEYLTPPGMTASPVFSRVVRFSDLETIYVSNLHGTGDHEQQIRGVFNSLAGLLENTGSNLEHLVKGTYYVTDAQTSEAFTTIRRGVFDPQRPPAASKARVSSVGRRGRTIAVDMIAVTPPKQDG